MKLAKIDLDGIININKLEPLKKIILASDFHLGAPNESISLQREIKIVNWLKEIEGNTQLLVLVGDIFDFWFEYRYVIPKGFSLFLGQLKAMRNKAIDIVFFTGNHDLWMYDYFPKEYGIHVFKEPTTFNWLGKKVMIGHGDGLSPKSKDQLFKTLKPLFSSAFGKAVFKLLPPDFTFQIAHTWSRSSAGNRTVDSSKTHFQKENEWIIQWINENYAKNSHDFYIFGHRHYPVDYNMVNGSRYFNLGEWFNYNSYLEISNDGYQLKYYN